MLQAFHRTPCRLPWTVFISSLKQTPMFSGVVMRMVKALCQGFSGLSSLHLGHDFPQPRSDPMHVYFWVPPSSFPLPPSLLSCFNFCFSPICFLPLVPSWLTPTFPNLTSLHFFLLSQLCSLLPHPFRTTSEHPMAVCDVISCHGHIPSIHLFE